MKTMKYLGCLLALVFAATSLHAKSTSFSSWFSTVIGDDLTSSDGTWANKEGWNPDSQKYNLNNWSSNTSLTFTVTTPKTLPGDVAAIKTTVKFTPMDAADFAEMIEKESSTWEGAKAGLTVVETATDPVTYTYYGIVSGEWAALTGEPDLEHELDVKVTLSKNGTSQFVKYEVGQTGGELTALTLNNKSEIATTATDDATISSVSYKGLCKLTALSGEGAKSIFDLTVPTKPNATAVVKVNGVVQQDPTQTETGDVVYGITSGHEGSVEVVYESNKAGWKVFGTQPTAITADLTGDKILEVDSELASKLIVAYVGTDVSNLENAYATLADAIYAVKNTEDADGKVTLIATLGEDETITVGKKVTLLNAGNDVEVKGSIAVSANGDLLVKGGKYDDEDFSVVSKTNGKFAFEGGLFKGEKSLVQLLCSPTYYADANDDETYITKVVKGTVIDPTEDVPAIVVDPAVIPAGRNAAEYMAEANTGNGISNWKNFALGLLDEETAKGTKTVTTVPAIIKDSVQEATASTLYLDVNVPGNEASGYTVVITDAKVSGGMTVDGVLTLNDDAVGNHVVKIQLKDANGNYYDVGVAKTIGVDKPTVSEAESNDVKLVTVPYKQIDGSAMTIDEVINRANLKEGDTLSIYNGSDYDNYILTEGEWVAADKSGNKPTLSDAPAPAPAPVTVKPGQGLWLKTTAENYFQYGLVDSSDVVIDLVTGWNLIGVPGSSLALTAINDAEEGDMIRVENVEDQIPVEYTYDGTYWKYNVVEEGEEVKLPNGRTVKKKIVTVMTASEAIPVNKGSGVWYVSKTGEASINL